MKVRCCKCKKEYDLQDNIFEQKKSTDYPILVCPHCGFKHLINFMPFEAKVSPIKKVKKLDLKTYYVVLGASRIGTAYRVEVSLSDDEKVTQWERDNDFILATRIYTSKGPIARAYKLRWREVGGTFADVESTGIINYSADTVLVDGTVLVYSLKLCDVQVDYTWQNGLESEGDNILPDSGTYSLADEYYTVLQWALNCSGAAYDTEYEFELWDVTEGASIGTCVATIKMGVALDPCPYEKLADPSDLPATFGGGVAFSGDDVHLAQVMYNTSPYMIIYKRSGDTFVKIIDPLDVTPPETMQDVTISHDNVHMALISHAETWVTVYKRDGDAWDKLSDPSQPEYQAHCCEFSHDSLYLAVGTQGGYIFYIYKRSGDSFSRIARPKWVASGGIYGLAWSHDSIYLTVVYLTQILVYKRTGDSFNEISNAIDDHPNGGYGLDVAWSPDSTYMAVGFRTYSPYVTIYKRNGDVFAKLETPNVQPLGRADALNFSSDGLYLVVAHSEYPYLTIYKRNGDIFTKVANPVIIPTGTGRCIALSSDGTYLAMGTFTSPYIIIYKIPAVGGLKWNTKTIIKWCGKVISKWNTK